MINNTGWTWDQVGRLTLRRYLALCAEWRRNPPLHLLFKAYLGIKDTPQSDTPSKSGNSDDEVIWVNTPEGYAKFASFFGQIGGQVI